MARAVGWVLGTIQQLAKALGVSPSTARRRAASGAVPGAVKSGTTWIIPMTTGDYARGAGVSARTARRRIVAKTTTPTDDRVTAAIPSSLPQRGKIPTKPAGTHRMVAPDIWPYQYQGAAWIQFISSGDVIRWFTGVIVSRVKLTVTQFRTQVKGEVERRFGLSPVHILKIDLVYGRHA